MGAYNLTYNKDESIIRQIIIGLLADLNKKVYFYSQYNENERVKINIPFIYSITGDESFLQENFLNDNVLSPYTNLAKTNYEAIPRAIINMTSMSIDSGSLLNKYVYGIYNRLIGQEMKSFRSQFQMIPINFGIDVEIIIDNQLDSFKVTEAIIKRLYKNNAYIVEVGNLNEAVYPVSCQYKLPEDYTQERSLEFSLDDDKNYKITFSLELEAFIPSIDFDHEMFAGNRMFNIKQNTFTVPKRMEENGFGEEASGNLTEKEKEIQTTRQLEQFTNELDDN
jgi:hypothetical protein